MPATECLILGRSLSIRTSRIVSLALVLALSVLQGCDYYILRLHPYREEVVGLVAAQQSDHVADIGCQDGFWSYVFAREVGLDGQVYALDIDEEWVKYVQEQSEARGLSQIQAIECLPDDTTLEDESVDVIFIANTIHHIDDIPAYTRHLYRILRPGGRYVVIDNWTGRWGHNSDPDEIVGISADAGFVVSKRHRFEGTDRYLIVFIKPSG